MTVSAFGASGLWNLMNVAAFRATDRRHLMNVLSFGASALWKLMIVRAFRTSGLWTLMNVSAECLSFLPPLLPGAIAWGMLPGKGDESDSPRSGYAGQKNPA